MSFSLAEINRRIAGDPERFVMECDAQFHKKIMRAADAISANIAKNPIVLMSGPSGSGKTTTAQKIEAELKNRGINTHSVSLDDYYKTIDPKTAPRTPEGEIDYESPQCIDLDLLDRHFSRLAQGGEIQVPHFKFSLQMRSPDKYTPLRLRKDEIAIFEGIHALNDCITEHHPNTFKLYISARSNVEKDHEICFKGTWMRLVRRVVRDNNFRGAEAQLTLSMWDNVRRGEKMHISPYKNKANMMLDSSLPYEVSALKHFAIPVFSDIPEETARFAELQQIIPALALFHDVDVDLVPPESLIREFIGGGIYQY